MVVIIHSIGVDRPGIVADVTRIVTDKGGNVGESRAQLLGGHFSLMMQVDIAEKDVGDLQDQLATSVAGMKTECLESVEKNATVAPTIACEYSLMCYELCYVMCYVIYIMFDAVSNHRCSITSSFRAQQNKLSRR